MIIRARLDGLAATAGGLIDRVKAFSRERRREMINRARAELGLPSTGGLERREVADRVARARPSGLQVCHAEGCTVVPTNDFGALERVAVKRWFCAAHRDQAAPGDMEPPSSLRVMPGGWIAEVDPGEDRRQAAAEESLRRRRELELAEAREEAQRVPRAAQESRLQICHADGCSQVPVDDFGALVEVDCRKWFCPQHRDQAAAGDLAPPPPAAIRIEPGGWVNDVNPIEVQREAVAAESLRRRREAQFAERRAEAERAAREEQAAETARQAELPSHLRRSESA